MITFLPQQIEYENKDGETVLQAAAKAGLVIDGTCAGMGTCGKCRVRIIEGPGKGYALACKTMAENGMVIETALEKTDSSVKEKPVSLPQWFRAEKNFGQYGVAVDIGTTTVVIMLWNLENAEPEGIKAISNPQRSYGADIISRLTFAEEKRENLEIMQSLMVNAINDSVEELCSEKNISRESIAKYAVVGNTAMSRLFRGAVPKKPEGAADVKVYIGPDIAGHVGSDITAGIMTTDIMEKKKNHLFIDIGTNGEMVLAGKGRICACSTAAGPAFEGGSISQGMRGAPGAIEHVTLTPEGVHTKTIGDAEPEGICGSGIIDAVAELVRMGIVDKGGRILDREELRAGGVSEELISYVRQNGVVNDFVLYKKGNEDKEVLITQKDIREVQLAKGAVEAGIKIMMKELGIRVCELDRVSVAGAFGNYIRTESAITLGLLPPVPEEKVFALGNSAGVGASMMLLSEDIVKKAETAVKEIEHIELADRTDFQEEYIMAMMF